jgi:hypothetical protein
MVAEHFGSFLLNPAKNCSAGDPQGCYSNGILVIAG